MPDVFISYSRKDKDFVRRLADALKAQKQDVWVDWEDIPFASDWQEEIFTGIDSANSAVFVISPDSLASQYCSMEVNYINKNKKRLIPIVYREADGQMIVQSISHLNWIFFDKPDTPFDQAVTQLVKALNTDLDVVKRRTWLLMRARDWERKGHSNSLLLRGEELDDVRGMLTDTELTDLQRTFLEASIQHDLHLQVLWRFIWGFIGGLLGMGFWAFSVFPSESGTLITPLRLIYAVVLGEVFGIFNGMLAVLAEDGLPFTRRVLPPRLVLPFRILATLLISIAAWGIFGWFYQQNPTLTQQDINSMLFGGVGLAAGFLLRILFPKLPTWLATVLTAVFTYIPIYVTFQQYWAGTDQFQPLIYVSYDNPNQIYSIGIPIVIFIALGAAAQPLWRDLRTFLNKRNRQEAEPAK
jgi:hypothetical protein